MSRWPIPAAPLACYAKNSVSFLLETFAALSSLSPALTTKLSLSSSITASRKACDAALTRITGNFEKALIEAGKILQVKGQIIPVTAERSHLFAELEDGQVIAGETNIDVPAHDPTLKIEKVWLEPQAHVTPSARRAILDADLVIIGPGDLYTSIVPNLLVGGVSEALRETNARVVYITNVMTKHGETNHFQASNFLRTLEDYVGHSVIDAVLVNDKIPSFSRLQAYREEYAEPVVNDLTELKSPQTIARDLIRPRGYVRHDPDKLAQTIQELASKSA